MNDEAYADPAPNRGVLVELSLHLTATYISEPHPKTQQSGRVLHDSQLPAMSISRTVHFKWWALSFAILNASYDISW